MSTPLSDVQQTTLAAVLDALIPPSEDGRLPGAGELGLATEPAPPELRPIIEQGLAALEELSLREHDSAFAELAPAERAQALTELGTTQPAFVPGLMFHTYVTYYQHDRVQEGLGLEVRPPFPDGYDMEPSDLSLLDPVRERPKLYREV